MTLRRINETVPNDGVIRVYDFLCQERLLLTEPKAFGEVLVQNPYVFTKTFQLKYNVSRLIGEGLACSEGEEHRVSRPRLMGCCCPLSKLILCAPATTQAPDAGVFLPPYQRALPIYLGQGRRACVLSRQGDYRARWQAQQQGDQHEGLGQPGYVGHHRRDGNGLRFPVAAQSRQRPCACVQQPLSTAPKELQILCSDRQFY